MKPELRRGAALFNAGHWWEAHEAWEGVWTRSSGSERHFVQALILLAAALHKRWVHGSQAHRNYHKALRYLALLPPEYDGVNLERLRGEVWRALEQPHLRPVLPLTGEQAAGATHESSASENGAEKSNASTSKSDTAE